MYVIEDNQFLCVIPFVLFQLLRGKVKNKNGVDHEKIVNRIMQLVFFSFESLK